MGEWRRADGTSLAAPWLPFICLHLACSTVSHSVKIFHWIRREPIELYAPDTRISSSSASVFSSRLLSGYRGARLRPDARDPPLIRLVAETTRGPVKASTSAAFSRSPPFIRPFFLRFFAPSLLVYHVVARFFDVRRPSFIHFSYTALVLHFRTRCLLTRGRNDLKYVLRPSRLTYGAQHSTLHPIQLYN